MDASRIFIVDDDELLVADLGLKLEGLGYTVVGSAANATEAVRAVLAERPDLVLMDIVLEGDIDGIEAARGIQAQVDIPIVYLTAYTDEALLERARVTDPFGYVVKPASLRELHAVISIAIYKAAAERELRAKALACDSLTLISDAVITLDADGRVVLVNRAAKRFLRVDEAKAIGLPWMEALMPGGVSERALIQRAIERAMAGESTLPPGVEVVLLDVNGDEGYASLRASPHRMSAAMGVTLMFVDIAELKSNENALRVSERRFRDVVEAAGEYVWEVDAAWRYSYVSTRFKGVLGYGDKEILAQAMSAHLPPDEKSLFDERLRAIARDKAPFKGLEYNAITQSGAKVCLEISGLPLLNQRGELIGFRGVGQDVSQRKDAAARIEFLATRDHLTGLPNRTSLFDHLEQHLAEARREAHVLAVLFIDLDNFKFINDSHGHDVGDVVLRSTTQRMLSCIRERDTLARIGGDEFVMVLGGFSHVSQVHPLLCKVLDVMRRPCEVKGMTLVVHATVGVSIFPGDGGNADTLVRNADTAMYHAKAMGRDRYQFFSKEMNDRVVERLAMENAMRHGLRNNEFILHYQPKIDARAGKMTGVEALVRWNHPEKGLLLPAAFIPLAEETGMIVDLGAWVLRKACGQAREWVRAGHETFKTAVNLSLVQVQEHLPRLLQDVLREAGLAGRNLELEITESIMMNDPDLSQNVMRGIRDLGVGISIDDFGTGYSSLSLLQSFPFDTLKIDQSFVRDLPIKPGDTGGAIIRAIVSMAEGLRLSVIAEGVENEAQVRDLRAMECFEYQGYLFGHPLPAAQFAAAHFR